MTRGNGSARIMEKDVPPMVDQTQSSRTADNTSSRPGSITDYPRVAVTAGAMMRIIGVRTGFVHTSRWHLRHMRAMVPCEGCVARVGLTFGI